MSQNLSNPKPSSGSNGAATIAGDAGGRPADALLSKMPHVVNVGVPGFAGELAGQGVDVVQLDWRPPAGGDARLAKILSIVGT